MPATASRQDTIYADLQDSLNQGDWKPGTSLPSLRKLADRYSTSIGTVRSALTRLQYEGKVVAQHGSGYYVSEPERAALKTVLLIAHTEGDLWSDFVQLYTDRLSSDPGIRLILERQPTSSALPALQQKIECYLEDGLEAILFDGAHGSNLECLQAYLDRTRLICFEQTSFAETWNCGKAISDNFHGGYIGARHLLDQGARDILILFPHTYPLPSCSNQQEIHAGACQAIEDAPHAARIRRLATDARSPHFADLVQEELAQHPQTDAIFSFCDFRFEHIVPRLQAAGTRIPRDIRLLGYYDTPWCQRFEPLLSSINVQPPQIVDAVIDMLHSGQDRTVLIRPKLVIRGSSTPSH